MVQIKALPGYIPMPPNPLVGREQEVAQTRALLLRPEARLVTLAGTGGVGKTHLALHVAASLQAEFADGVFFISLASLRNPELVLPTISHALGFQEARDGIWLRYMQEMLHDRHVLLLLDNFEQVIAAAPSLVELLALCPRVKLLVTSRAALHVRGEYELLVAPLALPDPDRLTDQDALLEYSAVALFIERARQVAPALQLTPATLALIAEICHYLDGLPLALELAAARLKLFSLSMLLERLRSGEQRLQLLTSGARDLPPRQQTLLNTLAWSYELLSPEEQQLFRTLSICLGGCTVEAVETMYAALHNAQGAALNALTALLDNHLVQLEEREGKEPRLTMLETVRAYGNMCLTEDELMQARQAHMMCALHLAETAETHLYGAEQQQWLDRLEVEHDNLRAALSWSIKQSREPEIALRLGAALLQFWIVRSYVGEGRSWLDQALALDDELASAPSSVKARALAAAGWLAFAQDDDEHAKVLYERCLSLCRATEERREIARSLLCLGWIALKRGDSQQAKEFFERCLSLSHDVDDKAARAYFYHFLARAENVQGHCAQARLLFSEGLTLFTEIGSTEGMAWSRNYLGQMLLTQDEYEKARAQIDKGLLANKKLQHKGGIANSHYMAGLLALCLKELDSAEAHFKQAQALFKVLEKPKNSARALYYLARIALLQGDKTTARLHFEEGLALLRQMHDILGTAYGLQGLGDVVAQQGELVWAALLWGAAEEFHEQKSFSGPFVVFLLTTNDDRVAHKHLVSTVRRQIGERAFTQAWAEGRRLTLEQVLSLRGHPLETGRSAASNGHKKASAHGLTEREREVLRLVAQGLTDTQVAEALVISPRTVNAHLRTIYGKLNIASRYAATHYALTHDLL